jgi:hypothetical protein
MTDNLDIVSATDLDDDAEEYAVADVIGFRSNPQKGNFLAISMVRSLFKDDAYEVAAQSTGERTKEQLEILAANDVAQAVEFLAFSSGYLAARMFRPTLGEGRVLSHLLLPPSESIPEAIRKNSIERATDYLPALSEIHDNRSAPRDSRFVMKLLSHFLAVLIEDPRASTLDTLLLGYQASEGGRTASSLTARQISETLDRARLWATLGQRRGLAERRFRVGPRAVYLENISGDVRVILDPDRKVASFSDIRRLRLVDLETIRDKPHPCDDAVITGWIADNCAAAQQVWSKPREAG